MYRCDCLCIDLYMNRCVSLCVTVYVDIFPAFLFLLLSALFLCLYACACVSVCVCVYRYASMGVKMCLYVSGLVSVTPLSVSPYMFLFLCQHAINSLFLYAYWHLSVLVCACAHVCACDFRSLNDCAHACLSCYRFD